MTAQTSPRKHRYALALTWEGNEGTGTAEYARYGRQYRVRIPEKPDLLGSADPAFRGDGRLHNPEDLLVAALAGCHMLSYLALCARAGVRVTSYADETEGVLTLRPDGGGSFEEVVLHPRVTVAPGSDVALAESLHARAAAQCFIAGSCNFPVRHLPEVRVGAGEGRR
jgi:organic hydroperoxide reductase OsmC/OhrA